MAFGHMPVYVGILISLLVIIPLSLIRDLHLFHKTSTLGFLIAVGVLISICIYSFGQFGTTKAVAFNSDGIFKFIGVAMFAYEGICTILPVRYSM